MKKLHFADSPLARRLNIKYPIIQAPMAGGSVTPELVAAASNAGALGSIAAGFLSPEQIRTSIQAVKQLTEKPFAVNLFIPRKFEVSQEKIHAINAILQTYRGELGLPTPKITQYIYPFDDQIQVVLDEGVPVFSFTFGIPAKSWLEKLKTKNIITIGTATSVSEAIELERHHVDIVVGQGSEAGGHRGSFLQDPSHSLVGTMALIPQIADAIHVPIVAAGGIMDSRGIAAALYLGASGVQMGTAFLTCAESGVSENYKRAVMTAKDNYTMLTKTFTGRMARGIKNRFMEEMSTHEDIIPDYPIQHALTTDIRKAAAQQGRLEFMSIWAGQGARLCTTKSVSELIATWVKELE